MQMDEAMKLNHQWGNKPCDHPNIEKEYARGTQTGDYVCSTCGEAGWGKHWNEEERKNKVEPK